MQKQEKNTIKKNILLDWIYKQKNNIPIFDLIKFLEKKKLEKSENNHQG
jgi:hypothetical protein